MPYRSSEKWYGQFRTLLPIFIMTYGATFVVLCVVGVMAQVTGRHVWFFTNDPFVLGHLPFYAGIISNIGMLLWCSSASICFFTMAALGRIFTTVQKDWRRFLLFSGILTSMLLFDDLLQLHQIFYPKYFHVTTIIIYSIYAFFAIWYLCHFKRQIQKTEFLLLFFALGFFILAIFSDGMPLIRRGRTAISDGFKLLGIVSWFSYFSRTCIRLLAMQLSGFRKEDDNAEER